MACLCLLDEVFAMNFRASLKYTSCSAIALSQLTSLIPANMWTLDILFPSNTYERRITFFLNDFFGRVHW